MARQDQAKQECDRQTARYRPAQTATNGSRIPSRVLNPAPLFLLGAGSRGGTNFLEKKQPT